MDKIELIDEFGNKTEFKLLDSFGMDEDDYAVLLPVDEEDAELYLLRIEEDEDGQIVLVTIDDEEEMQDAIKIYDELKAEKLQ
ncbi:MAG: DUF1292 domain-containing protein [Tissierellia bacterium]|nr:DUF1292 domain-containing protein [Tissierellia bacterium]